MKISKYNLAVLFLFVLFIVMIILFPKICINSAKESLILCADVLIPALFPITVCVLFIQKNMPNLNSKNKDGFSYKIFGLDKNEMLMFFLSILGGYPMGAKLLNERCIENKTYEKRAKIMQNYFVNGGVGFIVVAVGEGIYGSKKIGYILYFSHIFSSLVICFLLSSKLKKVLPETKNGDKKQKNIVDEFVLCVSDGADMLIKICAFTVFFYVLIALIKTIKHTGYIPLFLEISSAVRLTKNIYLIAFLLGFSGVSVIFQVISMQKNFKVNIIEFLLFRILHGVLSTGFVFVILKVFKVNISVISNGIKFSTTLLVSKFSVTFSLCAMTILFILSLEGKNKGGNLRKDLLK